MTNDEIREQLLSIAGADDFVSASDELVGRWSSADLGAESVGPVLEFMEAHPDLDYGMPGALVHFVEKFYGHGYEEQLLDSIRRRPTMHTVWMLNRVVNGAKSAAERNRLIAAMRQAATHSLADGDTIQSIHEFLA